MSEYKYHFFNCFYILSSGRPIDDFLDLQFKDRLNGLDVKKDH